VLCIDGRPAGEPFGGAADYLVRALAPQDSPTDQALVQVDVAPDSALLERNLGHYDCVFLCDVAQFTAGEAQVLQAYLKSGGNLVFFLGDAVLADRYNRELGKGAAGAHILPARLGPVVTEPQYHLNPKNFKHSMLQAFRGRGRTALLSTPVLKYFKLEVPEKSAAKVVLALNSGDPLIVEEPIERGRVVLVATSADRSWTLLPIWPSFVPLVQELLAFCVSGQLQQRNVTVGEPLGGSLPADVTGVSLSIEEPIPEPDDHRRSVATHMEGDYVAWSFSETMLSGIYKAHFGPPLSRSQTFAVNVDTAESDLTQLDVDELRNDTWPGIPFAYQTTWQNPEQQPVVGLAGRGGLPVDLLYVVLGLLLVETFLAWRFGHHTP